MIKKSLLILLLAITFTACDDVKRGLKGEAPEDTTEKVALSESVQTLNGEFIYIADAAVLKGSDYIYGVTLDAMATELATQVAVHKNDEFDMVPVIIKGIISPKPEGTEGWDEIVTIKEIIEVLEPTGEEPIRIQSEK